MDEVCGATFVEQGASRGALAPVASSTAPSWIAEKRGERAGGVSNIVSDDDGSAAAGIRCPSTLANLQYRIIFAVVTLDSVYVYDTQCRHPILALHHLHYSQLTDACWSSDGTVLFISSNDGYCSIVEF